MTSQAHAEKSRVATRSAPEEEPEFQIAPMIDILLVLLVFFMSISTTEVLQRSQEVQLPLARGAARGDESNGQMIVNVLWVAANEAGTIKVDNATYARAEQLIPELQARLEANPEMRMLIRADKGVRYEYLKRVLVVAGQAGVSNVTFSVVDRVAE